MLTELLRHGLRFIGLILVQGLILKNMEAGYMINPFLYVLFIIQLPFELPAWIGLMLAFALGFFVDIFYGTMGMHMAACTLMGWARPAVLRFMVPRDGYEFGQQPTMQDMGKMWFLSYAAILILIHHFLLFYIEIFSFREVFMTFLRVILSAAATLVLVVVTQFLFYRTRESA
ncbi:MAG TPA: rod shape-determining protein MreD [Bacteroidia bacterium]|nr:rod shape-determining protein MreD [Bacteroidia bacterium]